MMERKPLVEDIQNYAQNIVDTVREPLLILDATLRVRSANRAFYQTFHVSPEETEGRLIYELGNGQWDIPDLRTLLEDIVPKSSVFDDFELEHTFPVIGRRVMLLNARKLQAGHHGELLVLAMEDVTARKRAEEALLKAGALQSAIFNSANFSSIATDEKGVIQIFNVGAERMLGYTAAEVMNKITPADISDPQEVIARAAALSLELATPITPGFEALVFKAARGIEDIYELTYIRKDGSRFPAVVSVTALRDDQNAIIGYLLIGTDNTARKQAEEALLKAGALQNAIFNSANFSSIATDEKGVIQIFNVGAERMLGYTAAEVMNKITPADISDPQEVITRAKALSAELGTTITPGFEALVFKASRGIEDIYELTYIRKDGSRFPAIVSVTALRDDQGGIIGYLLIGTDNTARKQVEAERMLLDQRVRDQQFYTRSLIESNIDALITTDPRGIITDVNKQMEALTGCTRDELIGAPFKDYFTDPERAEAGIKLVLGEGKLTDYELTAPRQGRQGNRGVLQRDHLPRPRPEAAGRVRRRPRRHRTQTLRAIVAAGQPRQERLPGQHVARNPHPDERHPRVLPADAPRPGPHPPAMPVPGNHQPQRRASAGPDQRHPGDVQDRSGPHDPEPLHVRPARPAQRPGDDVPRPHGREEAVVLGGDDRRRPPIHRDRHQQAASGLHQRAGQRRQVHRAGRHRLARARGPRGRDGAFASGSKSRTRARAFRPTTRTSCSGISSRPRPGNRRGPARGWAWPSAGSSFA